MFLRWPRPKLLDKAPDDSETEAYVRALDLPAEHWRQLFLAAVKRVRRSDAAYADAMLNAAHILNFAYQKRTKEEALDTIERWKPGNKRGLNVLEAFFLYCHERDDVASRRDGRHPVTTALEIVGERYRIAPRSLRAEFSRARLNLHHPKGEMVQLPKDREEVDRWEASS
jgi:hypothetical protein